MVRVWAGVRVLVAGAAPHTRAWLRARAPVAGFDAAAHHEAGPSVQMMRVRFCLEAAEKPSYPAAYGILAMRMSTFLAPLILRCVASPYDGPTGNLSPGRRRRARSTFDGAARRAPGGVPSLLGGAAPLPAPF